MPIPLAAAGAASTSAWFSDLPETAASSNGFGSVITQAVEQAIEIGRRADTASTQALLGQASVTDLVLATSRAELTLQTAIALRDRVVSAYQEVMRMPI